MGLYGDRDSHKPSSFAMGVPRFELGTSSLSAMRSNQLSYTPECELSLCSPVELSNGVCREPLLFFAKCVAEVRFERLAATHAIVAVFGGGPNERADELPIVLALGVDYAAHLSQGVWTVVDAEVEDFLFNSGISRLAQLRYHFSRMAKNLPVGNAASPITCAITSR